MCDVNAEIWAISGTLSAASYATPLLDVASNLRVKEEHDAAVLAVNDPNKKSVTQVELRISLDADEGVLAFVVSPVA
jgi:hypothetical protein